MIILDATTQSVELVSGVAGSLDYVVAWADITTTTFTPGSSQGNITTATDTTIVAAPAASTQRQVKSITVNNASTTIANTVAIQKDVSGTEYKMTGTYTLSPGDTLTIDEQGVIVVTDSVGRVKTQASEIQGFTGFPLDVYKVGTGPEAAGRYYCNSKDLGNPSAWVPGTPGLNGWWTDSNTANNAANPAGATQTGSYNLLNPASGSYYLTSFNAGNNQPCAMWCADLIWYNTGIAVTTTTNQAITVPAGSKPARDLYGTTNGEGWIIALYVTTATTNGAAITNMTVSYTNSEGTAGRTATVSTLSGADFPATAVIGTIVFFMLQAGDRGVRSIEGITLGTSLGAGAVSLMILRRLATIPNPVANVGNMSIMQNSLPQPGVRIYNGSSIIFGLQASNTNAAYYSGTLTIVEK